MTDSTYMSPDPDLRQCACPVQPATADNIAYHYRVLAWQKLNQYWQNFDFKTEAEARACAEALGENGPVQLVHVLWQSDSVPDSLKLQPKQTPT
jgi:hypothetical protein